MKKQLLILTAIIMILNLTKSTEASTWIVIETNQKNTFSINLESVVDGPDGSKEAWVKEKINEPGYCFLPIDPNPDKCGIEGLSASRYFPDKTTCPLDGYIKHKDGTTKTSFKETRCVKYKIMPDSPADKVWQYLFKNQPSPIPPKTTPTPQEPSAGEDAPTTK